MSVFYIRWSPKSLCGIAVAREHI